MIEQITSKLRKLVQFFAAQGLTMAGNLLYGLLCVRLLPSSEYAKFVVIFGVQGTLLILMDTNFSSTLIPLIGERVHDRKLISDYVASLRQLSMWSYGIIGVGAVFCYPYLTKNRHWGLSTVAGMVVILLLSTWFMRISSAYGAVLILLGERPVWYQGQLISSLGTLTILGVFWAFSWVGAFQAILINVAGIIFVGIFYFYRARTLLGGTGISTMDKRRAIIHLALPNVPQAIFYALQGQISLFLITYFGHSTGIASVGALGRLGQIFALFIQANSLLVEPYFAKLHRSRLKKHYAVALLVVAAVSLALFSLSLQAPQLLLWALGPQYSGLNYEVKLVMAAGAISCFSSVLWCIHAARRFVFWWNVILSILLTLVVEIAFIFEADMGTVRAVLWLNLSTNAVSLFVNILSGAYGFLKGPRDAEKLPIVSDEVLEAESSLNLYSLTTATSPVEAQTVVVHTEPEHL